MRLSRSGILVGLCVGWTLLVIAAWLRSTGHRDLVQHASKTAKLTHASIASGDILLMQIQLPQGRTRAPAERPGWVESRSATQSSLLHPELSSEQRFHLLGAAYYRGDWGWT